MKLSHTILLATLIAARPGNANEDLNSLRGSNSIADNNEGEGEGEEVLRFLKGGKDKKKGRGGTGGNNNNRISSGVKSVATKNKGGGGGTTKKQKGGKNNNANNAKKVKGGGGGKNNRVIDPNSPMSVANYASTCTVTKNIPMFEIPVKPAKQGSDLLNRQRSNAINRWNRVGYEVSREQYEKHKCTSSEECNGCCCLGARVFGYLKPGIAGLTPANFAQSRTKEHPFGTPVQCCADVSPFTKGLTNHGCVKKSLGGVIGGVGPGVPPNVLPPGTNVQIGGARPANVLPAPGGLRK